MKKRPFIVPVGTLRRTPGDRRRESRQGRIGDLRIVGSAVPDDAEVSVDVLLESVHGGILGTGRVRTIWVGECRRCLAEAGGELAIDVRELFEDHPISDESYPLSGDQLDLEPLARDAVALELPLAPLCFEGCLGLCPECGANRNEGPCRCVREA